MANKSLYSTFSALGRATRISKFNGSFFDQGSEFFSLFCLGLIQFMVCGLYGYAIFTLNVPPVTYLFAITQIIILFIYWFFVRDRIFKGFHIGSTVFHVFLFLLSGLSVFIFFNFPELLKYIPMNPMENLLLELSPGGVLDGTDDKSTGVLTVLLFRCLNNIFPENLFALRFVGFVGFSLTLTLIISLCLRSGKNILLMCLVAAMVFSNGLFQQQYLFATGDSLLTTLIFLLIYTISAMKNRVILPGVLLSGSFLLYSLHIVYPLILTLMALVWAIVNGGKQKYLLLIRPFLFVSVCFGIFFVFKYRYQGFFFSDFGTLILMWDYSEVYSWLSLKSFVYKHFGYFVLLLGFVISSMQFSPLKGLASRLKIHSNLILLWSVPVLTYFLAPIFYRMNEGPTYQILAHAHFLGFTLLFLFWSTDLGKKWTILLISFLITFAFLPEIRNALPKGQHYIYSAIESIRRTNDEYSFVYGIQSNSPGLKIKYGLEGAKYMDSRTGNSANYRPPYGNKVEHISIGKNKWRSSNGLVEDILKKHTPFKIAFLHFKTPRFGTPFELDCESFKTHKFSCTDFLNYILFEVQLKNSYDLLTASMDLYSKLYQLSTKTKELSVVHETLMYLSVLKKDEKTLETILETYKKYSQEKVQNSKYKKINDFRADFVVFMQDRLEELKKEKVELPTPPRK